MPKYKLKENPIEAIEFSEGYVKNPPQKFSSFAKKVYGMIKYHNGRYWLEQMGTVTLEISHGDWIVEKSPHGQLWVYSDKSFHEHYEKSCAPKLCHGDILKKMANNTQGHSEEENKKEDENLEYYLLKDISRMKKCLKYMNEENISMHFDDELVVLKQLEREEQDKEEPMARISESRLVTWREFMRTAIAMEAAITTGEYPNWKPSVTEAVMLHDLADQFPTAKES